MSKIIPAKHFLKNAFTPVSDGGIIKLAELARLFGSDKTGRISEEQEQTLTELCTFVAPVQMNLFDGVSSNSEPKRLTIVLSSLGGGPVENLHGIHGMRKDGQGIIRGDDAYFANRGNVIVAMERQISKCTDNDRIQEIRKNSSRYGRVVHLGLLNAATATGKDIIYKPMKMTRLSEEMVARIKGRGYEVHAIVIDASLKAKTDDAVRKFDEGKYAFKSRDALEHAIKKDHRRLPEQLRKHLEFADTAEVLWWTDDPSNLATVLDYGADGWTSHPASDDFYEPGHERRLNLTSLTLGENTGIAPEKYHEGALIAHKS